MKKKCGYTKGCFARSFSFVSLDSFPFPPLKETAAPTTQEVLFLTVTLVGKLVGNAETKYCIE